MTQPKSIRKRLTRSLIWAGTLTSGVVFGGSCNTEVRSVVLSGLNELTVALIDALFVSLESSNTTTTSLDTFDPPMTPWRG